MPAAIAIPAIAAVAGAGISAYASHKASQAQGKATDKALDFEKQQAAEKKASFDAAMQAYEQKWNVWNSNRMALLQRYGVDIGQPPASGAPSGGSVSGLAGGPMSPRTAPAPQGQVNIPLPERAQTMGPATAYGQPQQQPQSVASLMAPAPELGRWNDWKMQGLQA